MSKKWCENSGRATCSPYASDNAACTQRPDRAPVESTIPKVSITLGEEYKAGHNECGSTTRAPKQKLKKIIKIVGASTLAIMMGASVLCGVLLAPMNAAQVSTSTGETSQTLSAEEKLVTGQGLGLDPENDPVIFTTESGIDIRLSKGTISSPSDHPLKGYAYVTMANNNWVIIGQSSSGLGNSFSIPSYALGYATSSYIDKTSIAGKAIIADNNFWDKAIVYNNISGSISLTVPNAVPSSELLVGELLCLSEKTIGTNYFDSRTQDYSSDYTGSYCCLRTDLESYLNNFSTLEQKCIKEVTLKTYFYGNITSISARLFPLAYKEASSSQNYCVETYLTTQPLRVAYGQGTTTTRDWWTRTGYKVGSGYFQDERSYYIYNTGASGTPNSSNHTLRGVRPAFVLKLA